MSLINEILVYSPKVEIVYKDSVIVKLSKKQAEEGGDRKFFNQYWQPFAWAAMLGYKSNRRVPISGRADSDMFKFIVINNQAPNILKALITIAIGKLDDDENVEFQLKKLKDPSIIVNIINEYANGGFDIINRKLKDEPDYFYEHNIFIADLLE
jgi:dnd system-associated protein 4